MGKIFSRPVKVMKPNPELIPCIRPVEFLYQLFEATAKFTDTHGCFVNHHYFKQWLQPDISTLDSKFFLPISGLLEAIIDPYTFVQPLCISDSARIISKLLGKNAIFSF